MDRIINCWVSPIGEIIEIPTPATHSAIIKYLYKLSEEEAMSIGWIRISYFENVLAISAFKEDAIKNLVAREFIKNKSMNKITELILEWAGELGIILELPGDRKNCYNII